MEEKKTSTAKRIVCLVLAVAVLGLAIAFSYFLIKGFSNNAAPTATPDNSEFVSPEVEVPAEKTPNELLVDTAFVLIDVILVVVIVYVLVRKPKTPKTPQK